MQLLKHILHTDCTHILCKTTKSSSKNKKKIEIEQEHKMIMICDVCVLLAAYDTTKINVCYKESKMARMKKKLQLNHKRQKNWKCMERKLTSEIQWKNGDKTQRWHHRTHTHLTRHSLRFELFGDRKIQFNFHHGKVIFRGALHSVSN